MDEQIDPSSIIDLDRHGDDIPSEPKESQLSPTPVLVDNKAVEFSVNNPETSQRTRHLDVRYFKVRDYIRDQSVRVRHIGTDVNVSDFFTKALPTYSFNRYREFLGMENHDLSMK